MLLVLVQKLKCALATIVVFDLAYYHGNEVLLEVEYRIEMGKETPHQTSTNVLHIYCLEDFAAKNSPYG
jgi:hypothetical protein